MYGGGGVEPDHRLEGPIEGFNPGRFARLLFARQVFASFAQKFSAVGDTRIAVTGKDRKFVAKDFTVDAAMLEAFREHLVAEGVKIDEAAFTQDLAFITAMIRYEIDLNLWTVEDARRHLIMTDPQAQLALTHFAEAERLVQAARGRASRGNRLALPRHGPAGARRGRELLDTVRTRCVCSGWKSPGSSHSAIGRSWPSTAASRRLSGPTGAARATWPTPSCGSSASRAPRACAATAWRTSSSAAATPASRTRPPRCG